MSFSGSSAARNSICAITRLAMVSSIGVPIKIMLSFRRREKMSYALSPRLVCSTTMGTSAIVFFPPDERLLYEVFRMCGGSRPYGTHDIQRRLPPGNWRATLVRPLGDNVSARMGYFEQRWRPRYLAPAG